MAFGFGKRFVFHVFRNYEHSALAERDRPVTGIKPQCAIEDQKRFVALRMAVPNEVALQLGQLEVEIFIAGDDLEHPLFSEEAQLFGKVDG